MSVDSSIELDSYLQSEFLFYLLPCYYAILAFTYRYATLIINRVEPVKYTKKIFGQVIFDYLQSSCQEGSGFTPINEYSPTPTCAIVKRKLSLINCVLYLLMVILSMVCSPSIFYGAVHKFQSMLYLLGSLAWYLSALLLKKQYERNMYQSLWFHRVFWIFSGALSITKMFEDYFRPLNVIWNCTFILTNSILLVYAIYRPEDNETIDMSRNQDLPGFVKVFFQTLELNDFLRRIFKVQANRSVDDDLIQAVRQSRVGNDDELDEQDLLEIQLSLKPTNQEMKEQLDLLRNLPRRRIFIDPKMRYIRENDRYRAYYFIITQIAHTRYQVERGYNHFFYLQEKLSELFNVHNFPKVHLPKIHQFQKYQTNLNSEEEINTNKAELFERWLQKLTQNPLFMTKETLQFLNVGEADSAPFFTYFEYSYKSFCSKSYLFARHKQNKIKNKLQHEKTRQSLIGYYETIQPAQKEQISFKNLIIQKMDFQISLNHDINSVSQYCFQLVCVPEKSPSVSWKVLKQQQLILPLNERIEQECKISVPFYYNYMSNISLFKYQERGVIYQKYLQQLLQTSKYYCPSLFQFIRFDPIKIQTRPLGGKISLSKGDLFSPSRESRYLEQYDESGSFIEVLRVTREEDGTYSFRLKRNSVTFRKKTEQDLKKLQQTLQTLYKGLTTVPQLNIESSLRKQQVKNRVQQFLSRVQALKGIQMVQAYLKLYDGHV